MLQKLTLLLDLVDISGWLTFVTVLLLVTAEVVSRFGPARGLLVDISRLRAVAIITGLIVLTVIAVEIVGTLTG